MDDEDEDEEMSPSHLPVVLGLILSLLDLKCNKDSTPASLFVSSPLKVVLGVQRAFASKSTVPGSTVSLSSSF